MPRLAPVGDRLAGGAERVEHGILGDRPLGAKPAHFRAVERAQLRRVRRTARGGRQREVGVGDRGGDMARGDADFDPIRNEPAFVELINA
jgi:hypothetical protein